MTLGGHVEVLPPLGSALACALLFFRSRASEAESALRLCLSLCFLDRVLL